jgi:bifunctional non-homologous end joining protein LigD
MGIAKPKVRKKSTKESSESEHYLTKRNFLPSVPGARTVAMPTYIQPMLATLTDKPFTDPEWLFEQKWDGIRALCFLGGKRAVRLVSRNQKEIGFRYPELYGITKYIDADNAILDGEIVVPGEDGYPNFQLLQSRMGLQDPDEIERLARVRPVVYYVFDLLYYNGFDLMSAELIHRKALLKEKMETAPMFQYSDHVLEKGDEFYRQIGKKRLEGMVAKRFASLYSQKRTRDWLKVKFVQTEDVVIGGYTKPRGSRELFGALIVGLYREGELQYVGHVGGGFNNVTLYEVYEHLQKLKTDRSPFVKTPRTNESVQWVKPSTVCEVKFSEWTADERLRQPIFVGIREDKEPLECTFEAASGA